MSGQQEAKVDNRTTYAIWREVEAQIEVQRPVPVDLETLALGAICLVKDAARTTAAGRHAETRRYLVCAMARLALWYERLLPL